VLRVAAVGPATAEAANEAGLSAEFVATNHSGAGLAEELREELKGKKVLLPRSDRANPDLPSALKRCGAQVTEVVAYKTVTLGKADRERVNGCCKDEVDGILFFSPSAVQTFLELVDRRVLERLQGRAVMVAIGPTTAGALSAARIQRIAWAVDTTESEVIQALEGHLARTRKRTTAGVK
jgi:uroporphyrinogen-III synthase